MATSTNSNAIGAYIVLSIFGVSAIILLAIIIHLIYMARTNRSRRDKANRKQVLFMIFITLVGVVSFLVSLLLIISMIIQIIVINIEELDKSSSLFTFYHSSFEEMQFFIAIFDQFGHLSMITVFIIRLKMCFENSMFGYSKILLRFIYCCLIILTAVSFVIVIQILNNDNNTNDNIYGIIITEVIWELVIEAMCLWLLYLFVSKLSELVIMSLNEEELNTIIAYLVTNKSDTEHAKLKNKGSDNMSIEDEVEANRVQLAVHQKLSNPNQVKPQKSSDSTYDSQIIYLVNIMTKMTVLVIIAVIGSILSVIGNILIETNEMNELKQIWLFILPVFDMLITSICLLYLQFNFTKRFYSKFFTKIDILFLRLIGCLLKYQMKNSMNGDYPIETQQNKDGEYAE